MIMLTHPTGNQNVRAALLGLLDAGLLHRFHTTVASFPGTFLHKIGHIRSFSEINKRSYKADLKSITITTPVKEMMRLMAGKFGFHALVEHGKGPYCIDQIYQSIDAASAKKLKNLPELRAFYGYEDAALHSFLAAKQLGLLTLYDLPIGYWKAMRQLLETGREARPEWATTLTGFKDSEHKLRRKDEELRLADHIFVASNFTKKTLDQYPGTLAPVHVIPYGFPDVTESKVYRPLDGRKLKLLFVGGLSQRKGIANVFEAVDDLADYVELTIVGRKAAEGCVPLDEGLRKHRWLPSLPHHNILSLMREHDILLFPSLFEGFGLVITEAMSQGTPVITTDRTAGPDLITNDENGWLIEAGNTNALKAQIENLLSKPELIKTNGLAAMEAAKKRPWTQYGLELAKKIVEISAKP